MSSFNYVDIVIIAIALLFTVVGYKRGLLVSVLNLVRSIFGVILCFFASSYCTPIVYENFVKEIAQNAVQEKLNEVANIDLVTSVKETVNSLPSFLQGAVDMSAINNISSANSVDYIMNSVVEPVATVIIKIIIFVLVFIVFSIIAGLIISLIENKNKKDKSLLGKTNRALGAVFGFVKAVVIVLAVVCVINFFMPYSDGGANSIFTKASESTLFGLINEYNPINFITK